MWHIVVVLHLTRPFSLTQPLTMSPYSSPPLPTLTYQHTTLFLFVAQNGWTAVHLAARYGFVHVVRELVEVCHADYKCAKPVSSSENHMLLQTCNLSQAQPTVSLPFTNSPWARGDVFQAECLLLQTGSVLDMWNLSFNTYS